MKALVIEDRVVEYRTLEWADIPPHKQHIWRDVIEVAPPPVDATAYAMTRVDTVEPKRVVRAWSVTPRDLTAVKAELTARIDVAAGEARSRYLTDTPGQNQTYDRKRREALEAIDNPNPSAERYPVLAASIGIEVPSSGHAKTDFDAVANIVIAKDVQQAQILGAIEALRLGAKRAIAVAPDVDVAAAAAHVAWP